MSFSTSQRTREFGVRMALGADRGDILRLVLDEGLKLAVLGVIVGIVVALPLTRLLRALLFGVTTTDPVTFIDVGLGLVLGAAAACYVPARRALKVDPSAAPTLAILRQERQRARHLRNLWAACQWAATIRRSRC